ncbi:MAG: zinc-dependent alcohol dehydrogenase family protein [Chromatiales bacterium]
MKAVLMSIIGGPEVLTVQQIPEPQIQNPGQIKVQVKAAGVNPVDTKLRARGVFLPEGLPAVLGCDGAGIVVETGSEVRRFRPGDEIWYCSGGLGGPLGNYAEFTLVDEAACCTKPRSLAFETAAAGPLVLITAWEALFDRARLQAGQTVLIHAGAGGVGHVAIQLAKSVGARVLTTVSSAAKADFVKGLGADEAIIYTEEDFVEAVDRLTEGQGAEVVLDTVGPQVFQQSIPAVAHYGDLVTLLDPGSGVDWKEARNRNLRIAFTLMLTPLLRDLPDARAHHGQILAECGKLIEAGRLRIEVARSLELERAVEAHRQIETGHTQGKLVLRP